MPIDPHQKDIQDAMCGLNKLFYTSAESKRDSNIPSPSKHSQIFGEHAKTVVASTLQEKTQQQGEEATIPMMNMTAQQDHDDDPSSSSSSEKQATSASVNFPQKVSSLCIYDS
jgi:hypothetical protein